MFCKYFMLTTQPIHDSMPVVFPQYKICLLRKANDSKDDYQHFE